ncbi:MAG: PQQ-binding-like beta-propeller repeat protein [Luteitalea sp.]|nr:PQQ-binding-like beta-propeller repeat protein [Luteitalea sp.]
MSRRDRSVGVDSSRGMHMTFIRHAFPILVTAALVAGIQAQSGSTDVTQWRGANRDGAMAFTAPAVWPEQLTQKWKVEVGLGYATPLVVGSRVYMFSRQGENEVMSALEAQTGKVLWHTEDRAPFEMNKAASPHGPGPKSTPVFFNGRLYSIGMTGIVTAYDANSGKRLWQKPGSTPVPLYTTHAFSPIVDNGRVIFHVGGHNQGSLVALDEYTGEAKWTWSGDGPGYGSPIVVSIGGTRQLVTITQTKIVGIDVANGTLLWERPFVHPSNNNMMTPMVAGNRVIVGGTAGPTMALNITRANNQWTAEPAWENADAPLSMSNAVVAGDILFGLSSRNSGQYFALDVGTGKTLWTSEGRQAANAAVLRAADLLFSLEDDGELIVARASKAAFEPVKRYKVADSATYAQPALAGNRIFVKDLSTLALWTLN